VSDLIAAMASLTGGQTLVFDPEETSVVTRNDDGDDDDEDDIIYTAAASKQGRRPRGGGGVGLARAGVGAGGMLKLEPAAPLARGAAATAAVAFVSAEDHEVSRSVPLCCRMFTTEYIHIRLEEAGVVFGEDAAAAAHRHGNDGAVASEPRRCKLTRAAAPWLIIVKLMCVAGWVVGTYYGVACIEELFSSCETSVDPPEESRSYQACVDCAWPCVVRFVVPLRWMLCGGGLNGRVGWADRFKIVNGGCIGACG
jgi:hypothetical protein